MGLVSDQVYREQDLSFKWHVHTINLYPFYTHLTVIGLPRVSWEFLLGEDTLIGPNQRTYMAPHSQGN